MTMNRRHLAGAGLCSVMLLGVGVQTPTVAQAAAPSVGSLPVGSASYTIPSGAIFVSPTGSDSGSGSLSSPFKTVAKGLAMASAGSTVVLRAGTYHENVVAPAQKNITIENYPNEAVWFDGSEVISGFAASGSTWVNSSYSYKFDSHPQYQCGVDDPTDNPPFAFVNASHPMAAAPDQIWIDGVEQEQVSQISQVTAGKFFVDTTNSKLYLGTNPSGHEVRASTLQQALELDGDGSIVRGIGFRKYANTMCKLGVVKSFAQNAVLENLDVEDSATDSIGIYRAHNTVNHVTIARAGQTGIHGNEADGLVVSNVLITGSNRQKFNFAPAAAGVKVSRTAGFTLTGSRVSQGFAFGAWTDEDVRDAAIVNSTFDNNAAAGIRIELSARTTIANNTVFNDGVDDSMSVAVVNSTKTSLWNNTISGPRAAVHFKQDGRTRPAKSEGVGDYRTPPDADMTWQTTGSQMFNNVFQDNGASAATLDENRGNVNNYAIVHEEVYGGTKNQMVAGSDSNLLVRPTEKNPQFAMVWQPAGVSRITYNAWADYRAGVPSMDQRSNYMTGSVVDSSGNATPSVTAKTTMTSVPSNIVTLIGHTPTGIGVS